MKFPFKNSLVQNSILHSPIIFLKLAENQVGEFDLILTPRVSATILNEDVVSGDSGAQFNNSTTDIEIEKEGNDEFDDTADVDDKAGLENGGAAGIGGSFGAFLNETMIRNILANEPLVLGSAPRWTLLGRIFLPDNLSRNQSAILLVIDSKREEELNIGRDWKRRALGEYEIYASASLLRSLNVHPNAGERLIVAMDMISYAMDSGLITKDMVREAVRNGIFQLQQTPINTSSSNSVILNTLSSLGIPLPPGASDNIASLLNNINANPAAAPLDVEATSTQLTDLYWPMIENYLRDPTNFAIECSVVDEVEFAMGKWPDSLGNVVVLESKYITKYLKNFIPSNPLALNALNSFIANISNPNSTALNATNNQNTKTIYDFIDSININDYAFYVIVQYRDRFRAYIQDNNEMNFALISFSNAVAEALGVGFAADVKLPVKEIVEGLNYLRIFLDQILNTVLVTLMGLGITLIYSLLLSDVEEKTYEYGMLRALGLQNTSLIQLLTIQSMFYAIPGIVMGLLTAWLISVPISIGICIYSSVPWDVTFYPQSILLGLGLGLLMPLISNIVPIQSALSKSLRDSLDVYHQSSNEVTVRMVRLENLGLSPWQVSASLMMVLFGFIVYYVIPYSFIFANISLFLTILNGILLSMLFGSSILASMVQPKLEKLILKLILWGKDGVLQSLVVKSLAGHRRRNKKTALMFTTVLAFIIFSGSMFTLQSKSFTDNLKLGVGSDLTVFSPLADKPLEEDPLREFLEQQLKQPMDKRIVMSYSFVTYPMHETEEIVKTYISNLADFPIRTTWMIGVDRDYLNSVYEEYYLPSEWDSQMAYKGLLRAPSKPDVVASLYDDAGKAVLPEEKNGIKVPPLLLSGQFVSGGLVNDMIYRSTNETYTKYLDVIVSEALRSDMFVNVQSPLEIFIGNKALKHSNTLFWSYLAKPRALVKKVPGFFYSSYKQTAVVSRVLISLDSYHEIISSILQLRKLDLLLSGKTLNETEEILSEHDKNPPKQRLLVRLKEKVTLEERELVMNGLRNHISDDLTFLIDSYALLATTEVATTVLLMFFDIVAVISSILCFFLLWVSFTSNIKENSWEFGVLRAIGLSAHQVIRVYIYEALCIVLSSLVLGSITGIGIALTLTLQFNLFTEMPFHFDFPIALFISIVVMSLVIAFVGSYLAAKDMKQKPIAHILKG